MFANDRHLIVDFRATKTRHSNYFGPLFFSRDKKKIARDTFCKKLPVTPATNIPYLIRDTRDTKNVHVNELEFIQDFTVFYQVGKITPTRNIPKVIIRTREKNRKRYP